MFSKGDIQKVYEARKLRLIHPDGRFDSGGRWYPSDSENADRFTLGIRSPSRSWPYSYMVAARTRRHVARLAEANPEFFARELALAKRVLPA